MLTRKNLKQHTRRKAKQKAINVARNKRTKKMKYFTKFLARLAALGITYEDWKAEQDERRKQLEALMEQQNKHARAAREAENQKAAAERFKHRSTK